MYKNKKRIKISTAKKNSESLVNAKGFKQSCKAEINTQNDSNKYLQKIEKDWKFNSNK